MTDLPEYGGGRRVCPNGIPGYTTYRIYITMPNATTR